MDVNRWPGSLLIIAAFGLNLPVTASADWMTEHRLLYLGLGSSTMTYFTGENAERFYGLAGEVRVSPVPYSFVSLSALYSFGSHSVSPGVSIGTPKRLSLLLGPSFGPVEVGAGAGIWQSSLSSTADTSYQTPEGSRTLRYVSTEFGASLELQRVRASLQVSVLRLLATENREVQVGATLAYEVF